MKVLRAAFAAAVVGATFAAAAPAQAVIVPQRSIAGVSIGATQAQVRAVLGTPLQVRRGRNEFGPYVDLGYRRLRVTFQGARRVTSVSTTRTAERTASGVGVGSTERVLLQRIRVVSCATNFGFRRCTVGDELPGRKVTAFHMKNGRVSRVTIGIVID